MRRDRVQSAAVRATWFQRRLGLATLRIHIAQPLGKVDIVDLAAIEADRLLYELVVKPSGRQSSVAGGTADRLEGSTLSLMDAPVTFGRPSMPRWLPRNGL